MNIVGQINGKVIAFGTVLITNTIEGKIGKIENIVTCTTVRGKGYGKMIIEILKDVGWME